MLATSEQFSELDRRAAAQAGITEADLEKQLAFFQNPPRGWVMDRPCFPNDGIRSLNDEQQTRFETEGRAAQAKGRISAFLPASGAASRLLKPIYAIRDSKDASSIDARNFARDIERYPFFKDLRAYTASSDPVELATCLINAEGLHYDTLPKALIPFHVYDNHVRTALEEHLVGAARYLRDGDGVCRVQLTILEEHSPRVILYLENVVSGLEKQLGCRYDITLSFQGKHTDTLAVDEANRPFRRSDGSILFRPGGHGALLRNLQDSKADITLINNIDNVVRETAWEGAARWKTILAGYAASLRNEVSRQLDQLTQELHPDTVAEVLRFLKAEFAVTPPAQAAGWSIQNMLEWTRDRLNRPLRVCGVVLNTGEPGGGPFWVRASDGSASLQLVESVQVNPEQKAMLASAGYFNPVNMACSLQDADGHGYELERFSDLSAVLISERTHEGRKLKALEWPGLWNGSMAGWNTVFVEIPGWTFNPVKTITDLLKPAHQR